MTQGKLRPREFYSEAPAEGTLAIPQFLTTVFTSNPTLTPESASGRDDLQGPDLGYTDSWIPNQDSWH